LPFEQSSAAVQNTLSINFGKDSLQTSIEKQPKDHQFFRTDHLRVSLASRTARGGFIAVTAQFLKFAISLAGTAVLARLLTPEDYGLIGMVAIITGFVSMYKDLGLSAATIQRPEINSYQISTLFWINIILSVAVTIVCVAIAPVVSRFYGEPRLTWIMMVTAAGCIFSGLAVQHEALLRRQMRFVALAVIGIGTIVAGYSVGILMAWFGYRYWSLVTSQLVLLGTNAVAVWVVCRWRPGLPKKGTGVRTMVRFGSNLTGFATINYFARNLDNLLIGKVWGAQQLGLYSRAYQLMMLPIDQINEPITSVAVPSLSRLNDSPDKYRRGYLRILEKIAILTMPGVALMIVTSDWIVTIMLGPKWSAVGPILLVLGISGLFQPILNTTGWLFVTQGRTHDMFKLSIVTGPITVLSILAGLPWGALGVATSYVVIKLCVTDPILYWYVGRRGPIRSMDFFITIGPVILASTCALLVCLAFRRWTAVSSPLAGTVFCALLTVLTTLAVLALVPAGRRALGDVKETLYLLAKKRSN
jgi:O-antigen/teichoic acid export membrane protein